MRPETLTQFLVDVTRGHRQADFASDPELVLSTSLLDEGLQAAVRERDIGRLWLAGAHPMALLYFARACGWDSERYYRCVAEAELRKAAPAAAPPPGHAPLQTRR